MLAGEIRRCDGGYHDRGCTLIHEQISQHMGELAAAEWQVCVADIKPADALLQREQRGVDRRRFCPSVAVAVRSVTSALTSSQVDQTEL